MGELNIDRKRRFDSWFRGWVPKDFTPVFSCPNSASSIRKHPLAIGYGAGMGVTEGIQWTLYFLGAFRNQNAFFTAQLIIIPVFITLIALGYWLSKKFKAAQANRPAHSPSVKNKGWIPKEPIVPHNRVTRLNFVSPPKIVCIIIIFSILALIVAAVIFFFIPFYAKSILNRGVWLVIYTIIVFALYRAYGRDYFRNHPKEHRFHIIVASGALTALTTMIVLTMILGSPKPYLPYLWIPVILLGVIGAIISDKIRKTNRLSA